MTAKDYILNELKLTEEDFPLLLNLKLFEELCEGYHEMKKGEELGSRYTVNEAAIPYPYKDANLNINGLGGYISPQTSVDDRITFTAKGKPDIIRGKQEYHTFGNSPEAEQEVKKWKIGAQDDDHLIQNSCD